MDSLQDEKNAFLLCSPGSLNRYLWTVGEN